MEKFKNVNPNSVGNLRFWGGYFNGSLKDFAKASGLKIHNWSLVNYGVKFHHSEICGELEDGTVFKIYDKYCTKYNYIHGKRCTEIGFDLNELNMFHIGTTSEYDTKKVVDAIANMNFTTYIDYE